MPLLLRCAQLTCRAEPDQHGELRNKCERVRETLRHCAGRYARLGHLRCGCSAPCLRAALPWTQTLRGNSRASSPPFSFPNTHPTHRRPDEIVESIREQTDGKPLDALDGSFLRSFLGREGSERVFDVFGGMSDAFRMAQHMQRAMQELLPGALLWRVRVRLMMLTERSVACVFLAELEGALPRRGGEGGQTAPPAQRRGWFGDAWPRGSGSGADAPRGGAQQQQRRPWEPAPGTSTKYEKV